MKIFCLSMLFVLIYECSWAQEVYQLTIKNHIISPNVLNVKADVVFKLEVKNEDSSTEEFESKKLNIEKFIGPKKTLRLTLGPLKPGDYDFFGEFHQDTANGKIIVK